MTMLLDSLMNPFSWLLILLLLMKRLPLGCVKINKKELTECPILVLKFRK